MIIISFSFIQMFQMKDQFIRLALLVFALGYFVDYSIYFIIAIWEKFESIRAAIDSDLKQGVRAYADVSFYFRRYGG